MLMQRQPFGSEANAAFLAAATAVDQSDAERLLQSLDTLTEGGLGQIQLLCCSGKTAVLNQVIQVF